MTKPNKNKESRYTMMAFQVNWKFDTDVEKNPNNVKRTVAEWVKWRESMFEDYYKQNNDSVVSIAWILHDKDIQLDTANDGEPVTDADGNVVHKPAHIHGIIEFKHNNRKRTSTVMKALQVSRTQNIRGINLKKDTVASAYRYLMHISETSIGEPTKHIYGFDEVHTIGDINYKQALAIDTKDQATNFIKGIARTFGIDLSSSNKKNKGILESLLDGDLIGQFYTQVLTAISQGTVTYAQASEYAKNLIYETLSAYKNDKGEQMYTPEVMTDIYHVFWIRYRGPFRDASDEYLLKRSAYLKHDIVNKPDDIMFSELDDPEDRNLTNIYIAGPAGTGKSQLAKYLGMELDTLGHGIHNAPAPSAGKTFDFTNTYNGEDVTVLNDIDAGAFEYREFFNVFDLHQRAPISSRNNDRDWFAHYALLTNSMSLGTFVYDMIKFSKGSSKYFTSDDGEYVVNQKQRRAFNDLMIQALRRITFYVEVKPSTAGHGASYYVYIYHKYRQVRDTDSLTDYAGHWLAKIYTSDDVTSSSEMTKVAKQIGDDMKQYLSAMKSGNDAKAFMLATKPDALSNGYYMNGAGTVMEDAYGYESDDNDKLLSLEDVNNGHQV